VRAGSSRLVVWALALASAAFVLQAARVGDYTTEAGPAIAALVAGHVHEALAVRFYMGPFAILVRVPFAWVATELGWHRDGIYTAGVVPCVAASLAVGLALARPTRRGESWLLVVAVLAVVSPPALDAVRLGHPEQILSAALVVGAALLALSGRGVAAGLALGLGIATKQDAVIAVVPVLLACPRAQWRRFATTGAVTVGVLYGLLFAGAPHAVLHTQTTLAHYKAAMFARAEELWFPAAHPVHVHVAGLPTLTVYHLSPLFGRISRIVAVLIGVPLGYLVWRRRPEPTAPLPLLALLFLIRCAIDPGNFDYFHAPFFLALLAWEVKAERLVRGLPVATLVAAFFLWLTFGFLSPRGYSPWLVYALYIGWAAATALYLLAALRLFRTGSANPHALRRA
jgi:hypothetical protein